MANETQHFFEETGHWLSGGFYEYWNREGFDNGVRNYGFPISEEYTDADTGITVQYFERARFEFQPELGGVVLGLLGQERVDTDKLSERHADAFARKPKP